MWPEYSNSFFNAKGVGTPSSCAELGPFAWHLIQFTFVLKLYPIGHFRDVAIPTPAVVWIVGVVDVTYKL